MALTQMKWYVVCPTPNTTNYITNPSFETNTTGWTAYNGTIAQSITQQAYGCYSCRVQPDTGAVAGALYPIALASGSTYVFSVDVYGVNGQSMSIWFADNVGTVLAGTAHTWTANGHWQRKSVTFAATASATFNLMVTRGSVASLTAWYFDAAQLEYSNESTYIDGDQPGLVRGETAYYWNGTRHASTSTRSAYTRAGGTLLCLNDYIQIKNVQGLGMPPIVNAAIESSLGGGYYQNTIAKPRGLIISGCVTADNATTGIEGAKQTKLDLIADAVAFDRTATRQEMILEYQGVDDSDEECSERLRLQCAYDGGLERSWDRPEYEDVVLRFTAYQPWFVDKRERAIDTGYQYEIAGANYILKRDGVTGQWGTLGTGMDNKVYNLALDTNGNLYACGLFHTAGGVGGSHIAMWNGAAWGSVGSGLNEYAYSMIFDNSGTLYVGGVFTFAGGVACSKIAKCDGTTWGSLSSGMNDVVNTLAIDQSGNLYAGGNFGTAGGVVCTRIAKWTGTTWGSLSSGMNDVVQTLNVDQSGNLYAGGYFGTAGGTACAYIAKWTGSAWGALSSGMSDYVWSSVIDKNGDIYFVGDFTRAGGGTVNHIAKWSGNAFSGIGSGANASAHIYRTKLTNYGVMFSGDFTSINGYSIYNRACLYRNNTIYPLSIILPGTPIIYGAEYYEKNGDFYIGWDTSGTAYSCIYSTPNCGGAVAYPFFEVTGPGTLVTIENYTTKSLLQFDNLFVNSGEIVRIDLDPAHPAIYSDTRGNLTSYLLPGSNLDLKLIPGTNNIDVFMYGGTDANSKTLMRWRNRYWTVDQAKYA